MDILARDIQSGDGVANAAISEAASRLRELDDAEKKLEREVVKLRARLHVTHKSYLMAQGICEDLADAEAGIQAAR